MGERYIATRATAVDTMVRSDTETIQRETVHNVMVRSDICQLGQREGGEDNGSWGKDNGSWGRVNLSTNVNYETPYIH